MIFWAGILVGAIFAWFALKTGFYETWAFVFNIAISIYLAVFLRPIIVDIVPAACDTPYSNALIIIATATASFLILHSISYIFFTSQFSVPFPKIFDTLGAGFLGFLAGFLVWSFACFLICITPISQNSFVKEVGFDTRSEQANIPYMRWWCNLVNSIVSSQDKEYTTEQVISGLLKSAEKKTPSGRTKQAVPTGPNDIEAGITEENRPGPPPDANAEDI